MEEEKKQKLIQAISQRKNWEEFLSYKKEHQHLCGEELEKITDYIEKEQYKEVADKILKGTFPDEYATKKLVNKSGTKKKRVVYSYPDKINIPLKFVAFYLYEYDHIFEKNCYAFRRNYGVKQALSKLTGKDNFAKKYCFKADIQDYFNSIDTNLLLDKLSFIMENDRELYGVFERILMEEEVYYENRLIKEKHGAMAGIPVAPFFANVYLKSMDHIFYEKNIPYFRYSDDVLIFSDTKEERKKYQDFFYEQLNFHHLKVNPDKISEYDPGDKIEFLGFSYCDKKLDLSQNTKNKIKGKIRRKARALRRWQKEKKLMPGKAAVGFINAMNKKFFGYGEDDEFTWERWFFPNLTTTEGLKEIDHYMQQSIRYCITGRHYKGNYRITYEMMKNWGYKNLVGEYYAFHNEKNPRV